VLVKRMLACLGHRLHCQLACSSMVPGTGEPTSVRPRRLGVPGPLPSPLQGCGLASMGVNPPLPSGMSGMLGACSVV
jgi:hypothetical protein